MRNVTLALCQILNTKEKLQNIGKAKALITESAKKGANIVILPEIFNCPYHYSYFRDNAEKYPTGDTIQMLSKCAKENKVYIVGGSIPEVDDNNDLYNTSFVFDDSGSIIARHRKMHLFDVDIKGGVKFQESKTFKPGNEITVVNTKYGNIGVAICYDIRFPELMRLMALKGAEIIIVPAAFNMTTGPAHWETLFKCRAVDNQVFMVGVAPARNYSSSYVAYGNSLVSDPWGRVVCRMDENEGVSLCTVDLDEIYKIREELPLLKHRRTDIYEISTKL